MFTNILKKDLIGIVGGLAGEGQLQWMRIVDISNPTTPKRLAGAVVGASAGMTLPIRIKWSPPTLAYLEAGQPSTVSLVNLQEFLIGEVLVANQAEYVQLPDHGRPGLDLNNDGDYVDPGEVLPLPAKYPLDFAGKDALFGVFDTDQAINDFALDNGGKYVGAVLDAGYLMGTNGLGSMMRPTPSCQLIDRSSVLACSWTARMPRIHFPRACRVASRRFSNTR